MEIETSIIIRTKNEEKWVGEVLRRLEEQTYQDFEVIVIDSGSKDNTLKIVKKSPKVTLLQIPPQDFSYPYALNYATERSKGEKYICILSAHSVPLKETFLEQGIKDLGIDQSVFGAYGMWRAHKDSTFWDKFFIWFFEKIFILGNPLIYKKSRGGILQFTNALFKREFWEKRKFDERYGAGGEDQEWAEYWIAKGYKVVLDKNLGVYHSHYLSLWGWIRQYIEWKKELKPAPFKPLKFRKSATHSL